MKKVPELINFLEAINQLTHQLLKYENSYEK